MGKITIIKTLIISKLVYLFINLPDPSNEVLKEIEQSIFKFLWGCKTHKIKKTTMFKSYDEGGFKMVDIFSFLSTLKLSWLKRLVTNDSTYSLWISLYPTLQNLNKFGFDFIKTCYTNVDNPFWFDVFKHYKKTLRY